MTTFNISLPQLQIFFLIFLRVSAIIMFIPIFDSRNIPVLFKAGLAFSISILLFPILKLDNIPFITSAIPFGIGVTGEILLGVIIGLSVSLIFAGIQLAGQLAGFQMGLAIANVMDPVTSAQVSVIAQLNNLLALLIFLTINAHHLFLRAIAESFRLVPPFDFQFSNSLVEHLISISGNMFIIAIKVGSPVIVALLLTSAAFGLISRTVPQMNVFLVAMPLKIVVGLLFLAFALPYLLPFFRQLFNESGRDILLLLRAMGN
ncbi:MAG: flagellar type III secretion system protein FliR [Desulfobacterales bacterium]|nr:flagellar type III secretion system protein FliR [Desulfobacterales bacterium]